MHTVANSLESTPGTGGWVGLSAIASMPARSSAARAAEAALQLPSPIFMPAGIPIPCPSS